MKWIMDYASVQRAYNWIFFLKSIFMLLVDAIKSESIQFDLKNNLHISV